MKLLRISMSHLSISYKELPQEYQGLGGRGLTSALINREVNPACDALGPENKLVIAPGLLSGTRLVNTSRISIGAKSPLTGGIKESNAGGSAADSMAKLGLAAVVIEGQPAKGKLYVLRLQKGDEAELIPAGDDAGLRNYAYAEKAFGQYGRDNSIVCIGPAGEMQLASASIQSTDLDRRPCRAAGRGGLGAVMGSKGLKAVVIAMGGENAATIAEPEAFKEAAKDFAAQVKAHPFCGQMLPKLGTAGLVNPVNAMGAFPSYNATKGTMEGHEKLSGEALANTINERGGQPAHMGCTSCIIHCSNVYVDGAGKYITSSLEYETIWSMGGMTGVNDLDTVAKLDYLCDDIGLDTMNTGVAVAVALDAGEAQFGDAQAVLDLVEQIGQGTGLGRVLGNGPAAVGKYYGHHRVPAVKGQAIAAYDPRGMQGNGVTYATSPMGADHTAGNMIGNYMAGELNPLSPEGQVDASRTNQITMAAVDTLGLCLLAAPALKVPQAFDAFIKALGALTGAGLTGEVMAELGMKTIKAELDFNRRAGLTKNDDRLPEFFATEPLEPHNTVFAVSDEELDSVWDQ